MGMALARQHGRAHVIVRRGEFFQTSTFNVQRPIFNIQCSPISDAHLFYSSSWVDRKFQEGASSLQEEELP